MDNFEKHILITGGAGFIGSHLVRHFVKTYPKWQIINLDVLTYAGNLNNLVDIADAPNYIFEKVNICHQEEIISIFEKYNISDVIHLAAESHVDRSISNPGAFLETNILGTQNLLHAAKLQWHETLPEHKFYHISTDEVYGALGWEGKFTEKTAYDPRSPYSASKASSDHLVRAYFHTYGLPIVISNCSNNYGPFQFPEKLIPLIIHNAKNDKSLPVYGKGENVRDWLWVGDHVEAIDVIFSRGKIGETYNIGGDNEWTNLQLVERICDLVDEKLEREKGTSRKLIAFVTDRPGHDLRYAIDASKIKHELGWVPKYSFDHGMSETIDWYFDNEAWLADVTSGAYQRYYADQYLSKD